jgi:type VI secretion system protein VasD
VITIGGVGSTRSGAAVAAAALLLGACAGDPKPKPTEIQGSIEASAKLNPSVSQRASPVMLRIYELKTAAAFNSADFVSMYQRDQAELAADLVAREEMVLSPGETRPYAKTLAPETRFIGVMAAYRDLERAKWRSIVAIQPGQKQRLVIRADELTVSAVISK